MNGIGTAHLLAEPRRVEVPLRASLLSQYARAEVLCRVILGLEGLTILALLAWWLLRGPHAPDWPAWLALLLGSFGVFRFIPRSLFLNKKRLADIRPDARFGVHTRDSLLRVVDGVFTRLGLPRDAAPVFLIREKDINAHAIRCELWPGQRLFNGVYLNRGLLHLFDERELACVVGHELGHVFPYAPLLSRCYLIHAAVTGLAAFSLTAIVGSPYAAILAPLGLLWVMDRVVAFPHFRLARGMEFLCDDYGVRAGDLLAALSCEMKLGAESETRQQLVLRALSARATGNRVEVGELLAAYEAAVPFGRTDPAAFEREFQQVLAQRRQDRRGISLGGFLESLAGGNSDAAEEAVREQTEVMRHVAALPVLALDRTPYLQGSDHWTLAGAERLVRSIRADPRRVLFRFAHEIDDRGQTHPNPSRRILFLWDQHTGALPDPPQA